MSLNCLVGDSHSVFTPQPGICECCAGGNGVSGRVKGTACVRWESESSLSLPRTSHVSKLVRSMTKGLASRIADTNADLK
jgi:hypothetical protein